MESGAKPKDIHNSPALADLLRVATVRNADQFSGGERQGPSPLLQVSGSSGRRMDRAAEALKKKLGALHES